MCVRSARVHRNVARVVEALAAAGLAIEPRSFPEGTKTAADAAAAIGVEVGQIVKSLVFLVDGAPVMALVAGDNQLSETKLSAVHGGAPSAGPTPMPCGRRPASPSVACRRWPTTC